MHSARIICCLYFAMCCTQLYSQVNNQPIYYNNEKTFFVDAYKENESTSGNCDKPVIYKLRSRGVCPANMVLDWTFTYYDCNRDLQTEKVTISIPGGKSNYLYVLQPKKRYKIKNLINEAMARVEFIKPPTGFSITGDTVVNEGDTVKLRVAPGGTANNNIQWQWYKRGSTVSIGEGPTVSVAPVTNTVYQLRANIHGFLSAPCDFRVNVKMKPSPPKDFEITGRRYIREGDTINLSINVKAPMAGVNWWWYSGDGNSSPVAGTSLTVHPTVTTRYRLQSELNRKRSAFKYFTVEVIPVPEPPSDFTISGKNIIKEGEKTTLRVIPKTAVKDIRWLWYRKGERQVLQEGDTMEVSPDETTEYLVRAAAYKKMGKARSFTVNVHVIAKRPRVIGNKKLCTIAGTKEKYYVSGGRLGTGSKKWLWYEINGSSEKQIGTGPSIYIPTPGNTTTYYVRPDAEPSVYTKFTVEVVSPTILPLQIIAPDEVCHDKAFNVKLNTGNLSEGAEWVWYVQADDGKEKWVKFGEGSLATASAPISSHIIVRAEGGPCPVSDVVHKLVKVIPRPVDYFKISQLRSGRNKIKFSVSNVPKTDQYTVSWYRNTFDEKISSEKSINYKIRRKDSVIYVQLKGKCDNLSARGVKVSFERKERLKYTFFNFGLAGKDPSSYDNGMITIGRRTVYLRAKFYWKDLQRIVKDDYTPVKPNYDYNDVAILNYPTNNTYYSANGNSIAKRTSYTLGFMAGLKHARIYLGAGYGKREMFHEFDIYDKNTNRLIHKVWTKNIAQSISGIEGESGLFIKLGGFNLMGGANMIYSPSDKRKYTDWHAGIGFSIKGKKR